MQRMELYMQHVADQQVANHRVRHNWMRFFTGTPCINQARIPALTHGLLPSSSGPELHGLEIGPVFRQGQDPQWPQEMKMELGKTMTWPMWWTTSFEEAEPFDQDRLKLWTRLYFVLIAFSIVCYLIVMELDFVLSLSVFVCYLIVIELDFIASNMLMCYFVVMLWKQEKIEQRKKRKGIGVWFCFFHGSFCPFDKCGLEL